MNMYSRECQRQEKGQTRMIPKLREAYILRDSWTKLNVAPGKIMQVCVCVCVCLVACVYLHAYVCVYVHLHACVYLHAYVCVFVCICQFMCGGIYKHM